MKKTTIAFSLLFVLLTYLNIGTGLATDDYLLLVNNQDWSLKQLLQLGIGDGSNVHNLLYNAPFYYFYFTQLYIFQDQFIYYDIVKILTLMLCIILVYKFSRDFMSEAQAIIFSAIFILYPIHDATNYQPISLFYLITPALSMYAFHLINSGVLYTGSLFGFLASFFSYASPPYMFGLSVIFGLRKEYKKLTLFLFPIFAYIVYYFIVTNIFDLYQLRTGFLNQPMAIIRHYLLQLGTFIDVAIGPSLWIKLVLSIGSLTITSFIIGLLLIYLAVQYVKIHKFSIKNELFISALTVMLLSFGMFSLSGLYPQMTFNLGNRVTTFCCLFLSLIIVRFLLNNRYCSKLVLSLAIFSVLGISDHWKAWHIIKKEIIHNISKNHDLKRFSNEKQLFVSHNHYSKIGNMNHIEFFPDGANARAIFKLATGRDYNVSPLNKRFLYDDKMIIDKKFGNEYLVGEAMHVYDSKSDALLMVAKEDINEYLSNLPMDYRHWVQLLDKENWIRKMVLRLMPRLDYIL